MHLFLFFPLLAPKGHTRESKGERERGESSATSDNKFVDYSLLSYFFPLVYIFLSGREKLGIEARGTFELIYLQSFLPA